ncbi:MAG: type II/IV secretion system ATPase subunit [Candidatus Burarchaeum sp.]|nr:type II/IV secretion system ATPase subunit [Candidatus Burarchaeum sp.]MDO8339212.1 type II/IV secretion system ATPase subunit [Candidatus Burarchaeum sp.]
MLLKTKIDELVGLAQQKKEVSLQDAAAELGMDAAAVERIGRILAKEGIVELLFPLNVMQKPFLKFKQKPVDEVPMPKSTAKMIETYKVESEEGHIAADVIIQFDEKDKRPFYNIDLARVSAVTTTYMRGLKDEIARELPLESEFGTTESMAAQFHKRSSLTEAKLMRDLGKGQKDLKLLAGILMHAMYGLGNIEVLMSDDWLEEIIVNNANSPVAVYHRKHGWCKTNVRIVKEEDIYNYSSQIGRKVGKQISVLAPILDAQLTTGDRVNATLYPISAAGNTITIRKFARNPWTLVNFIDKKYATMSTEMAAMLWQAMHYEMNVLIAGGTASGKTSALNALAAFIPPYQRIISIEDTREIMLPSFQWNWVPTVTRTPNPEGLGAVGMLDLMVASLRMRPDRIIVGEVRRRQEAEVLFEAMHTGHSVYSTLHADTGTQVIRRLTEPPIEVPPMELEALHLVVVQYRDRRKNIRKTLEISEVGTSVEGKIDVSKVYQWRPRNDVFEKVKEPRRYVEELNLHTGMTIAEIQADQKRKQGVLEWMVRKKVYDIEGVGAVMRAYYGNEDAVVDAAEKDLPLSKLL